jgi:hypothetical protein
MVATRNSGIRMWPEYFQRETGQRKLRPLLDQSRSIYSQYVVSGPGKEIIVRGAKMRGAVMTAVSMARRLIAIFGAVAAAYTPGRGIDPQSGDGADGNSDGRAKYLCSGSMRGKVYHGCGSRRKGRIHIAHLHGSVSPFRGDNSSKAGPSSLGCHGRA